MKTAVYLFRPKQVIGGQHKLMVENTVHSDLNGCDHGDQFKMTVTRISILLLVLVSSVINKTVI